MRLSRPLIPSRITRQRLLHALAKGAGGAGVGVLELVGEPPQLLERPVIVGLRPGLAQPGLDRRPVALGEMLA